MKRGAVGRVDFSLGSQRRLHFGKDVSRVFVVLDRARCSDLCAFESPNTFAISIDLDSLLGISLPLNPQTRLQHPSISIRFLEERQGFQ